MPQEFENQPDSAHKSPFVVPPLPAAVQPLYVMPIEGQSPTELEIAAARTALHHVWLRGIQEGRGALAWIWLLGIPFAAYTTLLGVGGGELEWAVGGGFALATALRLNRLAVTNEELKTALALPAVTPRWIGPLLELENSTDPRVKNITNLLLKQTLPAAAPADLHLLTPPQLTALYDLLTPEQAKRDPELTLAVLRAVAVSKDTNALSEVERLTEITAWNNKVHDVRVRARECMEGLEAIAAQEQAQTVARAEAVVKTEETALSAEAQAENALVESLLAEMSEEMKKHRKPSMRNGFLWASRLIIVPYFGCQTVVTIAYGEYTAASLFGLATLASSQLYRLSLSSRQSETARRLAQYDSVRAVGSLTDALDWPDAEIQSIAIQALTNLLPRMKTSDANLLNAKQRMRLYKMLRMSSAGRYGAFLIALLTALEQIGDETAVPFVEKIANGRAITTTQRRLKAKADECLPYLNENARNARSSQTLLRASSATTMTPDLLLRPASATPETAPEQLLRASSPNETP